MEIQDILAFFDLAKLIWICGSILVGIGFIIFGIYYKRRFAALEAKANQPAIRNTINIQCGQGLLDAINKSTTQNLTDTIRRLSPTSFGDGHMYATLPEGTALLSMADGTFRLAIPIRSESSEHVSISESYKSILTKPDGTRHVHYSDGRKEILPPDNQN